MIMSYLWVIQRVQLVFIDAHGDDAPTIMKINYDLDDIKLRGQSNNMGEIQIGAAFTFLFNHIGKIRKSGPRAVLFQ